MVFRKRVSAPMLSWGAKRRRTGFGKRRSRFAGRSRITRKRIGGYTTQSGSGGQVNFRTRRISKRRYRRILWNDGILKTHYRSIGAQSTIVNTPNNVVQAAFNLVKALDNGAGVYYTGAGGLQPVDGGVAVPTFGGTITLRGGVSRLTLTTRSTDDCVRVRVWAVWTNMAPAALPVTGTVPLDWDPSVIVSFQRNVGRVLFSREALLLPGANAVTYTYRFRTSRVDKEVFQNNGNTLYWFYTVMQTSNADIGPTLEQVEVVNSFNVSLSGDEVI